MRIGHVARYMHRVAGIPLVPRRLRERLHLWCNLPSPTSTPLSPPPPVGAAGVAGEDLPHGPFQGGDLQGGGRAGAGGQCCQLHSVRGVGVPVPGVRATAATSSVSLFAIVLPGEVVPGF